MARDWVRLYRSSGLERLPFATRFFTMP
jgi:hypothetical protein